MGNIDIIEELKSLKQLVRKLTKENKTLKEQLAKYETPKNSRNSSMPPSQDQNRPKNNQSLRKSSEKNVGGQVGHIGKTLEKKVSPDEIIKLKPNFCRSCGTSLDQSKAVLEQSRQIVDIPPVKAAFTEYQAYGVLCKCGCNTISNFPTNVDSPVSYGERIEGLIAYFHSRQYLPFARMKEIFNDIFNINISEGGIHYLLNRFADKGAVVYETIRQRVASSFWVGTDETGVRVNGERNWMWAWQNKRYTFITHSTNRGSQTINTNFPIGFPESILIHDGWKPQLNTIARLHQSCTAHLQRRLNYLIQKYKKRSWPKKFLKLLYDALNLKKSMVSKDYINCGIRDKIIKRFETLLENPPNSKYKELYAFYKSRCVDKKHVFTFLFVEQITPDNNASERAIRNIKVKQKISGQFKTVKGAQNFAIIRSVIDTTIKNSENVLDALKTVSQLKRVTD